MFCLGNICIKCKIHVFLIKRHKNRIYFSTFPNFPRSMSFAIDLSGKSPAGMIENKFCVLREMHRFQTIQWLFCLVDSMFTILLWIRFAPSHFCGAMLCFFQDCWTVSTVLEQSWMESIQNQYISHSHQQPHFHLDEMALVIVESNFIYSLVFVLFFQINFKIKERKQTVMTLTLLTPSE